MKAFVQKRLWKYAAIYAVWAGILFTLTGGFADSARWLASWMQWDTKWYSQIATIGYKPEIKALAFPPGYPLFIRTLTDITGSGYNMLGLVTSMVFFFTANVLAVELLSSLFLLTQRMAFFTLALTTPTGYLAFCFYSDPLFMLMIWTLLYLAIKHPDSMKARIIEASLLLVLPWIRIAGYALLSWAVLRRWTAFALLFAMAGWTYLNANITGDAFFFIKAQRLYMMPEGWALDGLIYSFTGLFHFPVWGTWQPWLDYLQIMLLPMFYLITLAAVGIWFIYKNQPLIGITLLSILAISHYAPFWRSVVRYDMPMMLCLYVPLFYMLTKPNARLSPVSTGIILGAFGMIQLVLQVLFANNFRMGGWAF